MDNELKKRGRPKDFFNTSEDKTVQSLDKALRVLQTLSKENSLSLTKLAEMAGVSAPTTYRALLTMEKYGLVHHNEQQQLWSIGIGAFHIGSAFLRKINIVEQARPIMHALMETTGETANLGILEGQEIVFINQVETHEPIRAFHGPGSKGTIYASGIGKALFAHMDEASARSLLKDTIFKSFTEKTITDVEALLADCRVTKKRGYAFDDEEHTIGMRCIAAPIFNMFQEPIAAVSVSGPTPRFGDDMVDLISEQVMSSASKITTLLGGKPTFGEG